MKRSRRRILLPLAALVPSEEADDAVCRIVVINIGHVNTVNTIIFGEGAQH